MHASRRNNPSSRVASADPLRPCPASKPLRELQTLTPLWYPEPQSILRVRSESPGRSKSGRACAVDSHTTIHACQGLPMTHERFCARDAWSVSFV